MKQLLIIIAAVVLVGCRESQQMTPTEDAKPVDPVAEAATPEPQTAKAPEISIHAAAFLGNIEFSSHSAAKGSKRSFENLYVAFLIRTCSSVSSTTVLPIHHN